MKARYFFILAALAAVFAVGQVVAHQRVAADMVDGIVGIDQEGESTSSQLAQFRSYTANHMGTATSVYLEASYNRDKEAAQQAAQPQANGAVYTEAQKSCASTTNSVAQARCVQSYVAAHAPSSPNPQTVRMPSQQEYVKQLNSPVWTPDTAGIALLLMLALIAGGTYVWMAQRFHHSL